MHGMKEKGIEAIGIGERFKNFYEQAPMLCEVFEKIY